MTTFPFDRDGPEPFYKQIYDGYRSEILSGRLRPGDRLPSTRLLAAELRVSRLPVLNAFEQLLHEGYIVGRAGSGTYVNESIPDALAEVSPGAPRRPRAGGPAPATPAPFGALRVSLPALDEFPLRLWTRLVTKHSREMTVEQMAYGDPAGHGPLRVAIADHIRSVRGVECDADQVLIVSGSQMALQICALALLGRGSTVGVEEPGYPGARSALTRTGARLFPAGVDAQGIDVRLLAASRRKIDAVYVTPSHQYPLGVPMSLARRLELLEWARRTGAWVIEDDYDSEYRYASRPLSALQGLDAASRVIYIGTFSKVLFPSLRIGYVVLPRELFGEFVRHREEIDLFSPVLQQLVLTEFLGAGHFARHVRRMRVVYEKRRDALLRGLRDHCGLVPHNSDAGLHLSVFLPPAVDDRDVARRAAREGIDVIPLSTCYAGRSRSGLVLGFGGSTPRQIAAACRTLNDVIRKAKR